MNDEVLEGIQTEQDFLSLMGEEVPQDEADFIRLMDAPREEPPKPTIWDTLRKSWKQLRADQTRSQAASMAGVGVGGDLRKSGFSGAVEYVRPEAMQETAEKSAKLQDEANMVDVHPGVRRIMEAGASAGHGVFNEAGMVVAQSLGLNPVRGGDVGAEIDKAVATVRAAATGGPEAIAHLVGGSLFQSVPAVLMGSAGALAGSPGVAIGTFLGSLSVEEQAAVGSYLMEARVDITDPEQLAKALSDAALMEKVNDRAFRRGVGVAAVEGLTSLVAGKMIGGIPGVKGKIAALGAESFGEGAGEVGGQVASGEGVDLAEATVEVIAGAGQSVGGVATQVLANRKSDDTGDTGAEQVRGDDPVSGGDAAGGAEAAEGSVVADAEPGDVTGASATVDADDNAGDVGAGLIRDPEGNPVVVYHGTGDEFVDFDLSESEDGGIYFTSRRDVAEGYTTRSTKSIRAANRKWNEAYDEYYDEGLGDLWFSDPEDTKWDDVSLIDRLNSLASKNGSSITPERASRLKDVVRRVADAKNELDAAKRGAKFIPRVIEANVSMSNPKVVDASAIPHWDIVNERVLEGAKQKGHDGAIIKNIIDTATGEEIKSDLYVVFDPSQIRKVDESADVGERPGDEGTVGGQDDAAADAGDRAVGEAGRGAGSADVVADVGQDEGAVSDAQLGEREIFEDALASDDPKQVEEAYRIASDAQPVLTPAQEALSDWFRSGFASIESFDAFGDPNQRQGNRKLMRKLRHNGKSLDEIAMIASEASQSEVTPADVVDFLMEPPATKSDWQRQLRSHYRALTGRSMPRPPKKAFAPTGPMEDVPFSPAHESRKTETERVDVAPESSGKPKALKDIVLDFGKGVSANIIASNVKRRGAAGAYFPGTAATTVRHEGDLDTTAHEVAHALDDRYGLVSDWATEEASPFDDELIPQFSEHGSTYRGSDPVKERMYTRAEGVAEWVRAYVVNPAEAKRLAPKFFKHFEATIPAKVRAAIDAFGKDVRTFAGASAIERTASNVEMQMRTPNLITRLKEGFASDGWSWNFLDRLNASVLDSLAPLWKGLNLAKSLHGIEHLNPSKDTQVLVRNFAGFNTKFLDILANGPVNAKMDRASDVGGLEWLLEPLDSSSKVTLESDIEAATVLMVNERAIEFSDNLNRDARELEALTEELDRNVEIAKEMGADTMVGGRPVLEVIKGLVDDIKRVRARMGYDGQVENVDAWIRQRTKNITGTGGGIYHDVDTAHDAIRQLQADPEQYARAQEAARRYRRWADIVLRYSRDKGRISKEQYEAIRDRNEYYVALNRVMDDIDGRYSSAARKLASGKDPVKRFKGSTRQIQNPYVSLVMQTEAIMREADRNEALRSFTKLLESDRAMYQDEPIDLAEIGYKVDAGVPGAIRVFTDGQVEHWKLAEPIEKALRGFGEQTSDNVLYKAIQILPRTMRFMITRSPDFLVRNVIRDTLQRSVISRSGDKPWGVAYWGTPKGSKEFDDIRSEYYKYGGGLFGHFGRGRTSYNRLLQDATKKALDRPDTIISHGAKILGAYGKFAESSELVGRMTEYRAAKKYAQEKLGYDEYDAGLYAAFQSRDLTDYAVAGSAIREANKLIPFLNAAIQGTARTFRGAKQDPKAILKKFTATVLVMEVFAYAMNALQGDDEELLAQPRYIRDLFWNFKLGPDMWLRIPKPWEIGVMGSLLGRMIYVSEGKADAKEELSDWAKSMLQATLPVDESVILGPFETAAEVMANHDFFRDKNIVSPWERDLKLELREGTQYASRIGQELQKVIGVDARYIDHVIKNQFGGFGKLATYAAKAENKGDLDHLLMSASGILIRSPAYAADDVQWIEDYAKNEGWTRKASYKKLRTLISAVYDAETHKESDAAAKALRDYAKSLRAEWTTEKSP